MSSCTQADCTQPAVTHGLCRRHYARARLQRLATTSCTIDGCGKPRFCRDLCRGHYARVQRNKAIDGRLHERARGLVVLSLRLEPGVLTAIRQQAAAAGTTPNKLAARILKRTVGVSD